MRTDIDLDLATGGYLTGPRGGARRIWGLEEIARDIVDEGVLLCWSDCVGTERGRSFLWSRIIQLSPALWEDEPWMVRRVLAHELGHLVTGKASEPAVERWMWAHYGRLVPEFREHARPL